MNHTVDVHQRWKERQLSLDVPTIARRMAELGIPIPAALRIIRASHRDPRIMEATCHALKL